MTLLQVHETRVKIKQLEASLPNLGLLERCEVEDEILELKKSIGEFQSTVQQSGDDCEACGS